LTPLKEVQKRQRRILQHSFERNWRNEPASYSCPELFAGGPEHPPGTVLLLCEVLLKTGCHKSSKRRKRHRSEHRNRNARVLYS
jgi:hypothetical protein